MKCHCKSFEFTLNYIGSKLKVFLKTLKPISSQYSHFTPTKGYTKGFLVLSEGVTWQHWPEIGEVSHFPYALLDGGMRNLLLWENI